MASGLPCIASDYSGNNNIIENNLNGKLFKIKDINALSNLILELLDDFQGGKLISSESKKESTFIWQKLYFCTMGKLLTDAFSYSTNK